MLRWWYFWKRLHFRSFARILAFQQVYDIIDTDIINTDFVPVFKAFSTTLFCAGIPQASKAKAPKLFIVIDAFIVVIHCQLLFYQDTTTTNRFIKMIPTALRTAARSTGRQSAAAFHTTASVAADVSVEHGRGEWKTYGDITTYKPGHFQIKTYNKISPHGLSRFPKEQYEVREG